MWPSEVKKNSNILFLRVFFVVKRLNVLKHLPTSFHIDGVAWFPAGHERDSGRDDSERYHVRNGLPAAAARRRPDDQRHCRPWRRRAGGEAARLRGRLHGGDGTATDDVRGVAGWVGKCQSGRRARDAGPGDRLAAQQSASYTRTRVGARSPPESGRSHFVLLVLTVTSPIGRH